MGVDYGARRIRRTPGQWATAGVAVALGLGFTAWLVGGAFLKHRSEALALRSAWDIRGPSCPSLTREAFEAGRLEAPKGVRYGAVSFYRRYGHMECSPLRRGGGWSSMADPACQFTSPGALRVVTAKGEWWFAPGPGRAATVFTTNGVARCVLAADFTLRPADGR